MCTHVPITEQELFMYGSTEGEICVAYTVWSYTKGSGRTIINAVRDRAVQNGYKRLITLSPLTDMAERFHLSNGARLVKKGWKCQNFEYRL